MQPFEILFPMKYYLIKNYYNISVQNRIKYLNHTNKYIKKRFPQNKESTR